MFIRIIDVPSDEWYNEPGVEVEAAYYVICFSATSIINNQEALDANQIEVRVYFD